MFLRQTAGNMKTRRYPCIRQQDGSDCGAACIATIARWYGSKIPLSLIRESAGTDTDGTSILGMVKAAKEIGFDARAVKGDEKALESNISLPAIALVENEGETHFVVIHEKGEDILVADPASGIRKYELCEFCEKWLGVLMLMTPSQGFKPEIKEDIGISRCLKLISPSLPSILAILACSLSSSIVGVVLGYSAGEVIDKGHLIGTSSISSLSFIVAFAIAKGLFDQIKSVCALRASRKMEKNLALSFFEHITSVPLSFFDSRSTDEIASRYIDAARIRDIGKNALLTIASALPSIAIYATFLLTISDVLCFIALVGLAASFVVAIIFEAKAKKNNLAIEKSNATSSLYLMDVFSNIRSVKLAQSEEIALRKVKRDLDPLLNDILRSKQSSSLQQVILAWLWVCVAIMIAWAGKSLVDSGELSPNHLFAFPIFASFLIMSSVPILNLFRERRQCLASVHRFGEVFNIEPAMSATNPSIKSKESCSSSNDIRICNACVRRGTRDMVLKNVNVTIKKSSQIAFISSDARSRKTLVDFLTGLYDCDSGYIESASKKGKRITQTSMALRVSCAARHPYFSPGTIRENILTTSDLDEKYIISACEATGLSNDLSKLPHGLNSAVGAIGNSKTPGLAQRISLTRALLFKPDLLVLEDLTECLGDTFEEETLTQLHHFRPEMIIIAIAPTIKNPERWDAIYSLENGMSFRICHTEDKPH